MQVSTWRGLCVCLCVCHTRERCKNGWTGWNAVSGADLHLSEDPCIRWGYIRADSCRRYLANTTEQSVLGGDARCGYYCCIDLLGITSAKSLKKQLSNSLILPIFVPNYPLQPWNPPWESKRVPCGSESQNPSNWKHWTAEITRCLVDVSLGAFTALNLSYLVASELNGLWLVAAMAKWVVRRETTQFAVRTCDQLQCTHFQWNEVRWDEMRWDGWWYERTFLWGFAADVWWCRFWFSGTRRRVRSVVSVDGGMVPAAVDGRRAGGDWWTRTVTATAPCRREVTVASSTTTTTTGPGRLLMFYAPSQMYSVSGLSVQIDFRVRSVGLLTVGNEHLLCVGSVTLRLFHRRTRASYVYNGCLAWYSVVLIPRIHSSLKFVGLPLVTRATVD